MSSNIASQHAEGIYRSRESQKAKQFYLCENCDTHGQEWDLRDGSIRQIGECGECGGVGSGVFCAICEEVTASPNDDFDFHHWDYDENIGVFLCRRCHDRVHETEKSYPEKSDEWIKHALRNAVETWIEVGSAETDSDEFLNRLNLPADHNG